MEQSKGFRRKVRGETEKEERQEGRIQRDTGGPDECYPKSGFEINPHRA